jgi:hypothetical protein
MQRPLQFAGCQWLHYGKEAPARQAVKPQSNGT